jgi:hypothetical protein
LSAGLPHQLGLEVGSLPSAASSSSAAKPAGTKQDSGIAFFALLEALQLKSEQLARSSGDVKDAGELGQAVEGARCALQDALRLQDQLLEAVAQARQQRERGPQGP